MQMTKMFRKQVKGINKQVKSLNRQVNRQVKGIGHDFQGMSRKLNHDISQFGHRRSSGFGIFTGLLLLALPVAGVALLLSNRQRIKQMIKSEAVNEKLSGINEKISETMHQPMIGKLQTQFHSFLEQVGFAKHEAEATGSTKGSSNGKGKHHEAVAGKQIQTMGEV